MKPLSKTFFLALSALIISTFIVSRTSDDDSSIANPVVTIDNEQNIQIHNGTVITGEISSRSNLTAVTFSYIPASSTYAFENVTKFDDKNLHEFRITLANVTNDITGIKVTATNKDGGFAEKTLAVMTQTPLSNPTAFRLSDPINNPSGLPTSMRGVTYAANTYATQAGFTGAFVMLTVAEYDAITTKERL
ncbi:MAG: hypothetical protein LBG19_03350 [Prevotellaceae bacterium]|jgi:hypothetical protein|nr:hypothetical protein [Prevotellaceae bacterium]